MISVGVAGDVLRDPRATIALLSHGKDGLHRYAIQRMLSLDDRTVERLYSDVSTDEKFNAAISAASKANRSLGGFARPADLYVICRALKPKVVVETGVASGLSSAFMLQALEDNAVGKLYSIDLPNADEEVLLGKVLTRLPRGESSGWIVPEWLRQRWDLRIGKSSALLPPLLQDLGTVDVFLHDSEHSYENMMFEFEKAWPRLANGGCVIADDVNLPASKGAFYDFAKKQGRTPAKIYAGFGVIRK